MQSFDLVIVGSGAAGTWAAAEAAKHHAKTLMLDVGNRPPDVPPLAGHLLALRRQDREQERYLIGDAFETLHNVAGEYVSPKLKSPRFRFVTAETDRLAPVLADGFTAVQSLARGGLATAWGGGAYRYTAADLDGWPLSLADLEGDYDELTQRIGIAGDSDDLDAFFGSTRYLQPPHPLDPLSAALYRAYRRRRAQFARRGFFLGSPRLALLSRPLAGRGACTYDHLTFWEPRLDYLYTPAITLDQLVEGGGLEYRDRQLVTAFAETERGVSMSTRHADTGEEGRFFAPRAILAAGALNSARIALASFDDRESRLPVLDNQVSMIPMVHGRSIGRAAEWSSHGLGQLNVVHRDAAGATLQATLYTFQSLLSSELIMDFPLPIRGALAACRDLLPALIVTSFFYPDRPSPENYLQLGVGGVLKITYRSAPPAGHVEREWIRAVRSCGFWSSARAIRIQTPGNGIHYAGTLPMSLGDEPYTCDPSGRLRPTRFVYVADGAAFPSLPAKNHTLTIMANAKRVARCALRTLGKVG